MLKFLGKVYTKCLSIAAWIILILGPLSGLAVWLSMTGEGYKNGGVGIALLLVFCLVGLLISFLIDVLIFGFISQVISIRESMERIEEKLDNIE